MLAWWHFVDLWYALRKKDFYRTNPGKNISFGLVFCSQLSYFLNIFKIAAQPAPLKVIFKHSVNFLQIFPQKSVIMVYFSECNNSELKSVKSVKNALCPQNYTATLFFLLIKSGIGIAPFISRNNGGIRVGASARVCSVWKREYYLACSVLTNSGEFSRFFTLISNFRFCNLLHYLNKKINISQTAN